MINPRFIRIATVNQAQITAWLDHARLDRNYGQAKGNLLSLSFASPGHEVAWEAAVCFPDAAALTVAIAQLEHTEHYSGDAFTLLLLSRELPSQAGTSWTATQTLIYRHTTGGFLPAPIWSRQTQSLRPPWVADDPDVIVRISPEGRLLQPV